MSRFAAIDIGSNSVKLLVAERKPDGSFRTQDSRLAITRLSRGLEQSGHLSEPGAEQTGRVLADFVARIKELGCENLVAVGTMALRTARDASAFIDSTKEVLGLEIEVLSGEEEARLSLLAIQNLYLPRQGTLGMLDIGGASTEISLVDKSGPLSKDSIHLGAVTASERFLSGDRASPDELGPLTFHINSLLAPLHLQLPALLVGVGGTLTTLAAVHLGLATYDANRIEGTVLRLDDLDRMQDRLGRMDLQQRQQVPGMEPKRADIILGGLAIATGAMRHLCCDKVQVSDRGLRHGLLIDRFGESQSNSTQ